MQGPKEVNAAHRLYSDRKAVRSARSAVKGGEDSSTEDVEVEDNDEGLAGGTEEEEEAAEEEERISLALDCSSIQSFRALRKKPSS